MRTIDRYILGEWLKMLGLILCATMGLLLVKALNDDFRDLLETGARVSDMLFYFATLMPSYLSVMLPLALLLSLLYVLGRLHRNNEITAIRAAGLNIFATTRSLWLAALFFCGLSLVINARVAPWSVEASHQLMEGFQFRAEARKKPAGTLGLVNSVSFANQRANRMWYMNRYSRFTGTAYGVSVSELDRERRERTRIMAREGHYDAVRRAWVFNDGREMWFDPDVGELMRSVSFTEKVIPHFTEDPELMLLLSRKPAELSFFELERLVDYFSAESDPKLNRYAVRYYKLLADTLGPLIILAIAIPFAVSGVRVNPVVGVSKSIVLFFIYYLLLTSSTAIGGNGIMDPLWAAWLPNLAMVGLAAFFFGRMR